MCRFLLVRSEEKIKPGKLLSKFASMCEKSHAPEGDWQGDGWGISIKNGKLSRLSGIPSAAGQITNWDIYKSLQPIWKDQDKFKQFGETNLFIVHARSAGFPDQKGIIEYNQPYTSDSRCFVFNGMIKGVNMKRKLEGKIGAQKIFSLIQEELKDKSFTDTLRLVDKLITENSREIIGMNIGLFDGDNFHVLCRYKEDSDYFGVRYYQDDSITVICSASIGDYKWKIMQKGDIVSL